MLCKAYEPDCFHLVFLDLSGNSVAKIEGVASVSHGVTVDYSYLK